MFPKCSAGEGIHIPKLKPDSRRSHLSWHCARLISRKLLVGGVDESCTRTCQPSDETQSVFTSKKLWRTNFKMKMWEKGFMNCSYDQLIEHFFHG